MRKTIMNLSILTYIIIIILTFNFYENEAGFVLNPVSNAILEGANHTLSCSYSLNKRINFELNGKYISPITSTSGYIYNSTGILEILNFSESHVGEYKCFVILNTAAFYSEAANLTLGVLPKIESISEHVTNNSIYSLYTNANGSIEFSIIGNPRPDIRIVRLANDQLQEVGLANSTFIRITNNNNNNNNNNILIIEYPVYELEGWYAVIVENQFSMDRFLFKLEILSTTQTPSLTTSQQILQETTTGTGTDPSTTTTTTTTTSTTTGVTINRTYSIISIEKYPNRHFYKIGDQIMLTCMANQIDGVKIDWLKNDKIILANSMFEFANNDGNFSLIFSATEKNVMGEYKCILKSINDENLIYDIKNFSVKIGDESFKPDRIASLFAIYENDWLNITWKEPNSQFEILSYRIIITSEQFKLQSKLTIEVPPTTTSYNKILIINSIDYQINISIAATNYFGISEYSEPIMLTNADITSPQVLMEWAPYIGVVLLLLLLLLIGIIFIFIVIYYKRCQKNYSMRLDVEKNKIKFRNYSKQQIFSIDPQSRTMLNDDLATENSFITNLSPAWNIDRSGVILQDVINEYDTVIVYRANIVSIPGKFNQGAFATVKMLKETGTRKDLRLLVFEMELMASIGYHKNIVGFLGACLSDPLYLITEYQQFGNLLSYLRSSRAHHEGSVNSNAPMSSFNAAPSVAPADLLSFAKQIASGMKFLSSKHIIHSKLMAQNVMVGEDKILKIAEYGQYSKINDNNNNNNNNNNGNYLKWTAPECFYDVNNFSTRSDVWSYGIVLWEIVTVGATPYAGVSNTDLYSLLGSGFRTEKPQQCPHELYIIMLDTWIAQPDSRPNFYEIYDRINIIINQSIMNEDIASSSTSSLQMQENLDINIINV